MTDGKFYLGKDLPAKEKQFLYKGEDLTTHAVVFGMTGSGKTGLCIDLLEEAIDEDIPITIIDPKGDVSNLALLFPDLLPENFLEWISPVEAKKEGLTLDEYSRKTAETWKNGLAGWGISSGRIRRIKEKTDLRIFTPGSSAGLPVSILEGFKKPDAEFSENEEMNINRIKSSVSALLSLLDIESDPLTSKPHILISNIIEHFWRKERSLTIEDLIINIQKPPIKKLGVFNINRIIDEKERIELAFKINNIIASSSFRFWKTGMPLSAEKFYKKEGGKIPVNIFYTAHLPENEKMFFSSLLLNEIVYWIKRQEGTTDLKYILYMDEIYGYLPPYPKNPPSKDPLMILMKQARAFGLGVVLVTQNPKDIDYKALTNTGTWFIGKLQAEGDRERVMEGLAGAVNESGEALESSDLREKITTLKKREFLVKNVHRKGVKTFYTRWAMSYLCGPLTIEQVRDLTAEKKKDMKNFISGEDKLSRIMQAESKPRAGDTLLQAPPSADIPVEYQYETAANIRDKSYSPFYHLKSEVIFDDNSLGIFIRKKYSVSTILKRNIDWDNIIISEELPEYSEEFTEGSLGFFPIDFKLSFSEMKKLQTALKTHLFSKLTLKLFINRELNIVSNEIENEEDFKLRCRDIVEKMIDKEMEKKKDVYEKKIKRLEDKIEREKGKIERLEDDHTSRKTEEIISIGETVLGFILGSKSRRGLSTAARRRRMTSSTKDRLKLEKIKLSQFEKNLFSIKEDLEDEIAEIEDKYYENADKTDDYEIRLEKEDIIISGHSILWKLI